MRTALFTAIFTLALINAGPARAADPLLITNADVSNVTNTTAIVSWQTNRDSTTTATYSQSPCPCPQGVGDPPERMVTLHSVQLSGLTADRDYYAQPVSVDRDGIRADGPVLHFTALHDSTLPTPVLSNITAILGATDNGAAVIWKTTVSVRGGNGVEYGTTPCPCAQNVQLDLGTGTDHRVEVPALLPNTTYYLRPFSYHPKDSNTIQYGTPQTVTTSSGALARSTSTTIQLLYPNGGETWNQGEQHLLSWKATPGFVNALRVALVNDKGDRTVLLPQLATEQRPSANSALLLPVSLPSGQYTLELANAANPDDRDTSDSTLTVGTVTPPTSPTPPTPAPQPPPAVATFNPVPPALHLQPSPALPTPTIAPPPQAQKPAEHPLLVKKPPIKTTPKKTLLVKKAKPKSKPKPIKKPAPKKAPVKR